MAVVTRQIGFVGTPPASLTVTYDDQTRALVRFNLDSTADVDLLLQRTGRVQWFRDTRSRGARVILADGLVQNLSDMTYIRLATS